MGGKRNEPLCCAGQEGRKNFAKLGSFAQRNFPMLCCAVYAQEPDQGIQPNIVSDGMGRSHEELWGTEDRTVWVARAGGRSSEKDPNQPIWLHCIPNHHAKSGKRKKSTHGDDEDQSFLLQAAAVLGE